MNFFFSAVEIQRILEGGGDLYNHLFLNNVYIYVLNLTFQGGNQLLIGFEHGQLLYVLAVIKTHRPI